MRKSKVKKAKKLTVRGLVNANRRIQARCTELAVQSANLMTEVSALRVTIDTAALMARGLTKSYQDSADAAWLLNRELTLPPTP